MFHNAELPEPKHPILGWHKTNPNHHHFERCYQPQSWLVYGILVGQGHPSEKYDFVNWDDDIPNISGKIKLMATKPPTSIVLTTWTANSPPIHRPETLLRHPAISPSTHRHEAMPDAVQVVRGQQRSKEFSLQRVKGAKSALNSMEYLEIPWNSMEFQRIEAELDWCKRFGPSYVFRQIEAILFRRLKSIKNKIDQSKISQISNCVFDKVLAILFRKRKSIEFF